MMLHHISLGVSDMERAAAFYDAALATLGYVRVWDDIRPGELGQAVGYGLPGGGDKLALKHHAEKPHPPGPGFHLAFAAPDRASVARVPPAALANGGTDNGAPGLRPHYGPHYYAAFVIDPDGTGLKPCSMARRNGVYATDRSCLPWRQAAAVSRSPAMR